MAKKIQMMSHDKEWQIVNGVETLVPVEQFDIDPITDSSCVKIEGFRTLEETLNEKNMFTPEVNTTKVMDKVGGEYHQNVVDGAYEEAILYGNTQVNLCEEDSSNALQIPTTFTSFNNGELQINNKENQVVAPLIKGVTMVNLAQTNSATIASNSATSISNLKGGTVYTLSFKFTTKNTNKGISIQSYNENSFIENTVFKGQLNDEVKFTFTTHANANKIAIHNPSSYGGETIQLDEIMLIEGDQTALDIPFFKGMKSVDLVRPLTNLFTDTITTYEAGATATNSSGNVTVTSKSSSSWSAISFKMNMLKNNTKYLVMWDSLNTTQTSTSNTGHLIGIYYVDTSSQNIGTINNNTLCPTKKSLIFDTKDFNVAKIWLKIHATLNNTETGTTTVTGLRVFEYDDYLRSVDLQSIGYFSGTKNVAVEPIKTCGKNLYPYGDINFTPTSTGWFDAKGTNNMYGDIAQKSKCRFLLRKGTYKLSSDYYNRTNLGYMSLVTDKEEIIGDTTFTLDKDTYLTLRLQPVEANVPTTLTNIQIERGETATAYVAHDSRYYEPNGQNAIVLRSLPNGVCDTFNLQTGEYTRRIGEVIFDGSEEWTQNGNGNYGFFTTKQDSKPSSTIVCDKLKEITGWNNYSEKGIFRGTQAFGIVVTSNELTTCNVETFKTWLSQNPLTVQYELATPTTTIIPRAIKRNNNGAVSTIDFGTYTNKESLVLPKNPTFLTINGMTSIKPVVEPITYIDFKTRLKTNTNYSVIIDKDSTDKTINLGGTSKTYTDKMLVRTPSINLEQNLRISGNGSIQNIMVIEGDVLDKELPYFNGMCNVKMPIVRNTGKNLFDVHANNSISLYMGSSNLIINNNKVQWNVTNWNQGIILRVKTYGNDKLRLNFKENTDLIGKTTSANGRPNFYDVRAFNRNKEELGKPTMNTGGHPSRLIENIPKNCDYIAIYAKTNAQQSGLEGFQDLTITNVDNGNICEPYRGNNICLVQGEIGLSQDMFEQGGFSGAVGNTYDNCKATNTNIRTRTKGLISVKPNSTYIINNTTTTNLNHVFYFFDEKQTYLGQQTVVNIPSFITPNNCRYMSLMFSKGNNSNILVSDLNFDQFQLLELDSTVQLRSLPNGVKDELNLLTGEYIQRVGEVTFDGSENWSKVTWEGSNNLFELVFRSYKAIHRTEINNLLCDKLNSEFITGTSRYGIGTWASNEGDVAVTVAIRNGKETLEDFKASLASSPVTLQYELAEPIISYPRIVFNTQEREVGIKLPNGVCDTYNPSTGITVKRVGKVILDGSENWLIDAGYTPTANLIRMSIKQPDKKLQYNNGDLVCDKLPVVQQGVVPCIYDRWNEYLYVDVKSSDIGVTFGTDNNATIISKFKTWLNANPITVYYELKYPVVTTDIVLPNGVHDDYNPITGLYTKRVGFIEFDGGETNLGYRIHSKGYLLADLNNIKLSGLESEPTDNILSNILVNSVSNIYHSRDITVNCIALHHQSKSLMIKVMNISTIDEYKTYLSQNPIKVWYELDTPQKIQLTPYFGLPMPYAYQGGHLIMDSAYDGVTLPPEFKYRLIANRTGQVNQNNIKLQQHTTRLSNLEAMLVDATLQSMYEREMMAFNLEMVNINLINLEE